MGTYFGQYLDGTQSAISDVRGLVPTIDDAAKLMVKCLRDGGTIFFAGNGGSASDSQHLAAELMGRFKVNREPLRSVCLNTDTSVMTATANDFGYEQVFARQVRGLARPGDMVVLISTSGESPSVLAACAEAQRIGALTIGLTGSPECSLAQAADIGIPVGNHATCHIQEAHITIGQALCGFVEQTLFEYAQ